MVLSKILVKMMREKNLNFASLSAKSGVSKSTIHGWTTGRKVQNLSELKRVATVLETSLHELAFGEPDPYSSRPQENLRELFSGDVRLTIHKIERTRSR